MSAGGLLGAALLGGIQGGAQTAMKVGEDRRQREWETDMANLKDQRARALEQMRFDNNMAVSEYEQGARAKESALDRASNERIAGMRASGGSSSRNMYELIEDEMGNPVGRFNKQTGQYEPYSQGGASVTPEMDAKAREIARERAENQAGWLSSDSSDFAEFGGSRQSAEEQFYREELQKMSGQQAPAGSNPLIQAVQSGQIQLRDLGEAQPAAGGGASAPTLQPSSAQQPSPRAGQLDPILRPGLLQRAPDSWQQQNASYDQVKPAVQNVKLALERGMSPSKEDFERARPYLSEKEIQEVERQLAEDAQYR